MGITSHLDLLLTAFSSAIDSLIALGDAARSELSWGFFTERHGWSILILALAAFVQTTVGFAAALIGLPLLMWAGNDLMESQIMIISAMLPQNLLAVWKLRKSIDLREIVVPAALRIAALPIGIAGLAVVLTWSAATINQFVAVMILFTLILQTIVGVEWKSAQHPFWIAVVFGGSGILQGVSGMSGPPMVLWVHAQRYTMDHARAFLFAIYSTNFLPQVLLLWWKYGSPVLHSMLIGFLALPLVLSSAMLGLKFGNRLGDRWLRVVSYAFLLWIALSSLLGPWLKTDVFPWIQTLLAGLK